MNDDILSLEPQAVWKHFYGLTRIARPSGNEENVRRFIAGFGQSLGLETIVDESGNVLIRKPATSGMADRKGIILQAHVDMVPQKNSDTVHDFDKDPIEPIVDGQWVRARGTTLGADNGIGVAAIMSVLESTEMRHGPLEALFTSNEESGMTGAFGLKSGVLRGSILLNLDSEDEGELCIGCAGGLDATMRFSYEEHAVPDGYTGFRISVGGLKGGHSGMDIALGRGNANKIMNRLLYTGYTCHDMLLASIDGGNLRNAIPRESNATVAVPSSNAECFVEGLACLAAEMRREFTTADPSLRIDVLPSTVPDRVVDNGVAGRLVKALYVCPNGVMRMSDEMPGLVETSNNLAVVRSENGLICVECLLRSSVDSARNDLESMIRSCFELAGASTLFNGGYPGWKPNPESALLQRMREVYRKMFGKNPAIQAVHAGLECGIIGATYPELDMISLGPTIRYPHSPDEKVNIASVGAFMDFLVETLSGVPCQ